MPTDWEQVLGGRQPVLKFQALLPTSGEVLVGTGPVTPEHLKDSYPLCAYASIQQNAHQKTTRVLTSLYNGHVWRATGQFVVMRS